MINHYKSERLPEQLKGLLSKGYLANERVYWQQRDRLLQQWPNQWVAVHSGQVIAVGEALTTVMDQVGQQGICDAYIEKVGGEFDTVSTIRHNDVSVMRKTKRRLVLVGLEVTRYIVRRCLEYRLQPE